MSGVKRPVRDADGPWARSGVWAYTRRVASWTEHLAAVRLSSLGDEAARLEGRALGHLWAAYLGDPS